MPSTAALRQGDNLSVLPPQSVDIMFYPIGSLCLHEGFQLHSFPSLCCSDVYSGMILAGDFVQQQKTQLYCFFCYKNRRVKIQKMHSIQSNITSKNREIDIQ